MNSSSTQRKLSLINKKGVLMGLHTPLYEQHLALGAEMAELNGWDLPLHFGSQVEEHFQVRKDCGMFDVSFMTIIDVTGKQAKQYLQYILANDVSLLNDQGRVLYSVMLNDQAGIIDDILVYLTKDGYRLMFNAGIPEQILAWMEQYRADFDVSFCLQSDMAVLAIQGPEAINKLLKQLPKQYVDQLAQLKPLYSCFVGDWFISRTGYTGEDGVEIVLPKADAEQLWLELIGAGIMPIGMRARDTLRLEAGHSLYGLDMDAEISPLSCNMDWTIAWQPEDRQFIGRAALEDKLQAGLRNKLIGLVSEERGTLHNGQLVRIENVGDGVITSTNFSPTLGKCIALARVPIQTGARAEVEIKGKWCPVRVVPPRFVWHGKILI